MPIRANAIHARSGIKAPISSAHKGAPGDLPLIARAAAKCGAYITLAPQVARTMDKEQHERGSGKEQKFHNRFSCTHGRRFTQRLCLTNAPLHVMILFELPRLAAVMGPLALPMKGVVRYFAEDPAH